MKSMKLLFSLLALTALFTFTSCGDDEGPTTPIATCTDGIQNGNETGVDCGGSCEPCAAEEVELNGSIGTQTLDASKIYIIDRFAYVDEGDVLTIPAGTILKANDGQGADASALIIARGGKLIAKGTADNPIILTSINDEIQPGETESTIDPTTLSRGQWGGLILLGKAPVSVKPADSADGEGREGYIEGVPSSNSFAIYGGNDSADSSGELEYLSIRYTGSTLSTDEEIQGLTLGGVGSGTKIENIEIYSSFDDGVEFFGGSVNVTNLLVAYQTDDAIDIDQSYSGTVDNAMVFLFNPEAGNDGMEIDGPEAAGVNDGGYFTVKNTTIVQKGGANIARFKSKAQGTVENFAAVDFDGQSLRFEGASDVTIKNSHFNESEQTVYSYKEATDEATVTKENNEYSVTPSTGATASSFNWTFSKSTGLF